jgi:hypothetical protein
MIGGNTQSRTGQRLMDCADIVTLLLLLIIVVYALVYVLAQGTALSSSPAAPRGAASAPAGAARMQRPVQQSRPEHHATVHRTQRAH